MELWKLLVASGFFLASWVLGAGGENLPVCSFPAIYNFGDSNSDTGGISAAFEPIRAPYGEAFFHKPAGRDSDGRLIIDFIAERLRLPYLSAYLNSLGTNYRHGANFATGGSTIRRPNETIYEYGISPFSLDMQTTQFLQFKARSAELYREAKNPSDRSTLPNPQDFAKALYTFDIGQNDLSVGFRKLSFDQIRAALPDILNQLATAVRRIYEQGGRSFWIHNTGPIGCLPVNLFYNLNPPPGYLDDHGCVKGQNDIAIEFNRQLKDRVIKLRAELPQAAITYVDVYAAKYGLISSAKTEAGFADPMKVCCGYHVKYDHVWCGNKGMVNGSEVYGPSCQTPSSYISWDGVHYTQGANQWVANHILNGSLSSNPPTPITQACHRS
ncbi:PREDICTED: GDSL esterase/lipase At5g14450-like isoform X1 [Prunus mume]|uniref:GDSL esterase/lipase At5g14450-like isoform X1 n=1 Tax=Prunus mume TaxID=102107 RepID=A0ABM0NVL5_PRUMU|nr:PREDICTED: GDSL esterase/lipase At5g14450-like isoform X1 [Prunus mume]